MVLVGEAQLAQAALCGRFGLEPTPPAVRSKLGVAENLRDGGWPINGLRHRPEGDTNGWYLWAGEHLSGDPNFFRSLHIEHLGAWRAEAVPYLALPPGWRFLVAPAYEDVWEDHSLLSR